VLRAGETTVYENPGALPRVLFAGAARVANFQDLLRTGTWPEIDFRRTVLLEQMPAGAIANGGGSARILRYETGYIEIEAESERGGYLVLNDPWHPWWTAWVNGYVAKIHRANVLFRAVMLPPGKHRVEFVFQPRRGLATSITDWLSGRALQ
jgi:hypothetical protein